MFLESLKKVFNKHFNYLIAILFFILTLFSYRSLNPHPGDDFNHFYYLAKSLLHGKVDIKDFPYHDVVYVNDKTVLAFPPAPSLLIMPFIILKTGLNQKEISIILGAINASLIFLLLSRFTNKKLALIISAFFTFGTVHMWASVVGTAWLFAQVSAVFYLLLSFTFFFNKKYFLSGIFFSLASLSRTTIFISVLFFVSQILDSESPSRKADLIKFLSAAMFAIPIQFIYNYLRFGNLWQTGYLELYDVYTKGGYAYSVIRNWIPELSPFSYIDFRNIPLHLYTFLIEPPFVKIYPFLIKPSSYGMGILFTSPLLLLSLIPKFESDLIKNLFFGAISVMSIVFLHYAQGWIQFGYRFLLDFLPFLILILPARLKLDKLTIFLVIYSIAVNFWGTFHYIKYGP